MYSAAFREIAGPMVLYINILYSFSFLAREKGVLEKQENVEVSLFQYLELGIIQKMKIALCVTKVLLCFEGVGEEKGKKKASL